jgi:diguanylate cyclase (GGDEF)-like protein/PAS domain S-box-containing protein
MTAKLASQGGKLSEANSHSCAPLVKSDIYAPFPQISLTAGCSPQVIAVTNRFTKLFGYTLDDLRDFDQATKSVFPDSKRRALALSWWWHFLSEEGVNGGRPRRLSVFTKRGEVLKVIAYAVSENGLVRLYFIPPMLKKNVNTPTEESERVEGYFRRKIERIKAAARERLSKVENALDALVDPHLLLEPCEDSLGQITDFLITHANVAAEQNLGVPRLGLLGKRLSQFAPELEFRTVMAWGRDVYHSKEPLIINDYAHCKVFYGEEERYDIRISSIDGAISWTWRNVTERHRAAQKLIESEEKYRLLARNSSDVVILSDQSDKIKWVSPSVTKMLGWDVQDWVGRREEDFVVQAEGEGAVYLGRRRVAECRNGNTVVARERVRGINGDQHWVEVHSGPYLDGKGQFSGVVSSMRVIDSQVEAEERLLIKARTDELTNLLNRKEALIQLEVLKGQAARTGCRNAVLFVDLDNFKRINDQYGHACGDAVLRAVADRIRSSLRTQDDIGARIGGDEMLAVLHGLHDFGDAKTVAEKLRAKIAEPIMAEGVVIQATASIGVVLSEDHEDLSKLVERADGAMYQAKAHGRNQVIVIE